MAPTQAWNKPISVIPINSVAVSSLTPIPNDKVSQMEEEKQQLTQKVTELSRKVQQLLSQAQEMSVVQPQTTE